jgi:hypothetical protein
MARLFNGVLLKSALFSPTAQPITLFGKSNLPPLQVSAFIDWKLYNNNGAIKTVGIPLDLGSGGTFQAANTGGTGANTAVIDRVVSVYIDNSGSNVPVYVVFPDTGHTIICGPQSTETDLALTNGLKVIIYGLGFTGGPQPTTQIFFSNTILQANSSPEVSFVAPQYFASDTAPGITNQTPYRALAVGDRQTSIAYNPIVQTTAPTFTGSNNVISNSMPTTNFNFGSTSLGTYVYITAVYIVMSSAWFDFNNTTANGTLWEADCTFSVQDVTFGSFNFQIPQAQVVSLGSGPSTNVTAQFHDTRTVALLQMSGLQIKARADASFSVSMNRPLGINAGATAFTGPLSTSCGARDSGNIITTFTYTIRDESNL